MLLYNLNFQATNPNAAKAKDAAMVNVTFGPSVSQAMPLYSPPSVPPAPNDTLL